MGARSVGTAILAAWAAAGAWAVDVEVHGHLYGGVTDDFTEGSLGPAWSPETPGGRNPSDDIARDGDARYGVRWEADVGLRAVFADDVFGNLLFTFDDRKQSEFYRYELVEPEPGDFFLAETATTEYVYASLEQANVEMAELAAGTDLTVGGFDVRYGHGGYYNGLVNRIDPVSFVAYLDPFGVRARREFGAWEAAVDVGVGLSHQAIAAATVGRPHFAAFAAAEGRTYDLKSLWDGHYASALPKFWRHLGWREGTLAPEPTGTVATFGDAIHAGGEVAWENSFLDLYVVAAYHRFADDPALEDPTGGVLMQLYPDFGVRVFTPRVWFRGAVLYEAWRANYHSTFGDGVNTNDYVLLFGEPQYFLAENLFVGLGGRYLNPSRRAPDDPITNVRENKALSVAALPHLSYAPAENVKLDLTYAETWWDPSYDLQASTFEEHHSRELKLEMEAAF